jgi:hypothetical protein
MGQKPNFAMTVAKCASAVVAPPGSDWARAVEANEEQGHRDHLKAMGLPPEEVARLIQEWRSLRHPRAD